jgi:hypothetical protein
MKLRQINGDRLLHRHPSDLLLTDHVVLKEQLNLIASHEGNENISNHLFSSKAYFLG